MKRILPIVCSILLIGCGDSSQTSTSTGDTKSAKPISSEVPVVSETPIAEPVMPTVVQEVTPPVKPISQTVTPAPVALPQKPAAPAKEKAAVKAPVPVTAKPAETAAADGKILFDQKCSSCHGGKAEKSALNKSQIIADFNEQQLKDALHGYQTGSYGKEMKGLMQGQVKSFSQAQIDALAKYISTL